MIILTYYRIILPTILVLGLGSERDRVFSQPVSAPPAGTPECSNSPECIDTPDLPEFNFQFLRQNASVALDDTSWMPEDAMDGKDSRFARPFCYGTDSCEKKLSRIQRLYNRFAWELFLKMNWPVAKIDTIADCAYGHPDYADSGIPWWVTWPTAREIFTLKKSEPNKHLPFYGKRKLPESFAFYEGLPFHTPGRDTLLLDITQSNRLNERPWIRDLDQFTQPGGILRDQAGAPVFYETMSSKVMFNLLTNKMYKLFTVKGQTDWLADQKKKGGLHFPQSTPVHEILVKVAWKILGPKDQAQRFLRRPGRVPCRSLPGNKCGDSLKTVELGMVGFHLMARTYSSSSWVFATFEHVDNLSIGAEEHYRNPSLRPLFRDESKPRLPVNVVTPEPAPTQVMRQLPIAEDVAALNSRIRDTLKSMGSVIENYQLIGTQYAAENNFFKRPDSAKRFLKMADSLGAFDSVTGPVYPRFLANTVLETFKQQGNTRNRKPHDRLTLNSASCIHCHAKAGMVERFSLKNGRDSFHIEEASAGFAFIFQQFARMETEVLPKKGNAPGMLTLSKFLGRFGNGHTGGLRQRIRDSLNSRLDSYQIPKGECPEDSSFGFSIVDTSFKVKLVDSGSRIWLMRGKERCSIEIDARNRLHVYKYHPWNP